MMTRWGLEGMNSFEQKSVARKEGEKVLDMQVTNPDGA